MAYTKTYDAVIVGSGPNGLSAGILLVQKGLRVKIFEAYHKTGGGMRTHELTLPGFRHDICSAIHPLAFESPFFKTLPLEDFGLEWVHPDIPLAHPLENGDAVFLYQSLQKTARQMGIDEERYHTLYDKFIKHWDAMSNDLLGPLRLPQKPFLLSPFGYKALQSAQGFAERYFQTEKAQTLFGGLAAHSIRSLQRPGTAAIGLVLALAGHKSGWPFPKKGAQSLADALTKYFTHLGGEISMGQRIDSFNDLPESKTYFFDTNPRDMAKICGQRLSTLYKKRLSKFEYGHGVFKIDAALKSPIPWKNEECKKAGTVHLGGTLDEICESERSMNQDKHTKQPFVLVAQHTNFDHTRAPSNRHTLWAYCHVPNGSEKDMEEEIFGQIERFAPGFRETVMDVTCTTSMDFEAYNPNYLGGDINGGAAKLSQLFSRPVLKKVPYRTSAKEIYLCSSSTPPGGGVHGMCGYHAARDALKRILTK